MTTNITLNNLPIGKQGKITKIGGEAALRQHLLDMGLIPGMTIAMIKYAPTGDPVEIRVGSYDLSLRLDDCKNIELTDVEDYKENLFYTKENVDLKTKNKKQIDAHPGLGENGKYHNKGNEKALPKGTLLTFALCGNQNCGKTTLFNALTGSSQHVGNFPGVTVDRKDGQIINQKNTQITDLPGIYSMSPYTAEEIVTRDFIINQKPKCIINIVDATNIERNLNLTLQLLELDMPMVVCLNMMDEVTENGGSININKMEKMLGVPVIPISAAKNFGIEELVEHAMHIAKFQEKPINQDLCDEKEDGGAVHRAIHSVMHLIEDHANEAAIPLRFAAVKLLENDQRVLKKLDLDENEIETLEHIKKQMEEERGLDCSAAIADMHFDFIRKVCNNCVTKSRDSIEHIRTVKIDKILTGKWTALPMFILIMGTIFYLTFSLIGPYFQKMFEGCINGISNAVDISLTNYGINPVIHSLIIDGAFAGVGSVVSFLPIIIILFFFLSLLEDLGYMARIAFISDSFLRKIGLSGRSIVPLLIGFGCSVPAVMASRTMPSKKDRQMTILLIPFMSCTAKLPIYAFFSYFFFRDNGGIIIVSLYLFGILMGILTAVIYRNTIFKGEAVPFVMELPNYRLPSFKNTILLLWEKAKDFLEKAFTIIFLASIVIWFLENFDLKLNVTNDISTSILAHIANIFVPIFRPIGLGDFRIVTALFSGFIAKESVVSTLNVLFPNTNLIFQILTKAATLAILVFCLIYTPCVAAIAAIKRELGKSWAVFTVIYQCVFAWGVAFIVYNFVNLIVK